MEIEEHPGALDANAVWLTLRHRLSLLEKHVRMLTELAAALPVDPAARFAQEGVDFVLVDRERLEAIVSEMRRQVGAIRAALEASLISETA